MPPQRPYLVLPSDIPDIEFDVLVSYCFNVEANSGDGSDVGVELQLVEDCYGHCQSAGLDAVAQIWGITISILVFPAASKPSMSRRISLDPNIFPMIFEICPPIVVVWRSEGQLDEKFWLLNVVENSRGINVTVWLVMERSLKIG